MKKIFGITSLLLALGIPMLFNSCASQHSVGSNKFASLKSGACDVILQEGFQSFHEFTKSQCSNCHYSGGSGSGSFGDVDLATALASFRAKGIDKVISFALDPTHKPPFTGNENQADISQAKQAWDEVQEPYNSCLTSSSGGEGSGAGGVPSQFEEPTIFTTGKLYNADTQNTTTLTYDLGSEISSGSPLANAVLEIDVLAYNYSTTGQTGVYISNPRITGGNTAAYTFNLGIQVNGSLVKAPYGSTWQLVERYIPAGQLREVSPNGGTMIVPINTTTDISIAVGFGRLEPAGFDFNPPTFSQLNTNVFQNRCSGCHTGNTRGGFDISHAAIVGAVANTGVTLVVPGNPDASLLMMRSASNAAPMPPGGLISLTEQNMIRHWILDGAPNN